MGVAKLKLDWVNGVINGGIANEADVISPDRNFPTRP